MFCFFASLNKRKQDRNLELLSLENVIGEHWPESLLRWCWWLPGGPAFKDRWPLQRLSEDALQDGRHLHSQGLHPCSFLVPSYMNHGCQSLLWSCHSSASWKLNIHKGCEARMSMVSTGGYPWPQTSAAWFCELVGFACHLQTQIQCSYLGKRLERVH